MATRSARETITAALRRLGILAEMESMSADMANDALTTLNDLMFGFPPRGINYTHTELALSDNVTLAPAQVRNLVLLLAVELAPDYGVTPPELIVMQAAQAEMQLQAAYPMGASDNTALGVCYQAFRRLRLATDGEGKPHPTLNWATITLAASADALRILNDLMFALPSRGINYTHTTLTASDAVPIGAGNIRALVLLLAKDFAFNFGVTLGKAAEVEIIKAEQQLQAAFPPTMNSTVIGLINQALQRIRVFAGSGNGGPALPWYFVSATSSADSIRTFNNMMHGLGPRGIYYVHTTLASGDTVNMPDEQIRNLILLLVREFSNVNGVPIPPQVMVEVADAERSLQAYYYVVPPAQLDTGVANRMPNGYSSNVSRA